MLLKDGNDDQLAFIDPRLMMMAREWERSIVLMCEDNTHRNSGIDPERQAFRNRHYQEFHAISLKRTAAGEHRWVLTNIPTAGYAQDADMCLEDFEQFYFQSTFADLHEPILAWKKIYEEQQ